MKKKLFAIFLVLALLPAALAGCGQDNGGSSKSDDGDEAEQLLAKGWYVVYDEDDELAGYLEVKSSKIIVYDETANEGDTLRYDFDAKKDIYTIDDGKLFGSEEFTVEKSRKKLILITEDDEYTLEEIDEEDMPGPGTAKTPGFDDPVEDASDSIELPLGCYVAYDGHSLAGYLKVERRTMTTYNYDGYPDGEADYSYNRDGACVLSENGGTFTVRFAYERGEYYMYSLDYDNEFVRLEPISESEIPVYDDNGGGGTTGYDPDAYYIGGNGSIGLYAWLPDELYDGLDVETADGSLAAAAQYYDYDAGVAVIFSAVLSSGGNLEEAVEAAWEEVGGTPYGSDSQMLFAYLRDTFLLGGLDNGYISGVYVGDDLDYDVVEDAMTVNGRSWRYCDVYITADDGIAYISMMFWMSGDDMALVIIGGVVEDLDYSDYMYGTVYDIIYSLDLDT